MALSVREVKAIMADLANQGCAVKLTKNGYMVRFPNGDSMAVHRSSPSDQRAEYAMRSRVRRAGLRWPPDHR